MIKSTTKEHKPAKIILKLINITKKNKKRSVIISHVPWVSVSVVNLGRSWVGVSQGVKSESEVATPHTLNSRSNQYKVRGHYIIYHSIGSTMSHSKYNPPTNAVQTPDGDKMDYILSVLFVIQAKVDALGDRIVRIEQHLGIGYVGNALYKVPVQQ